MRKRKQPDISDILALQQEVEPPKPKPQEPPAPQPEPPPDPFAERRAASETLGGFRREIIDALRGGRTDLDSYDMPDAGTLSNPTKLGRAQQAKPEDLVALYEALKNEGAFDYSGPARRGGFEQMFPAARSAANTLRKSNASPASKALAARDVATKEARKPFEQAAFADKRGEIDKKIQALAASAEFESSPAESAKIQSQIKELRGQQASMPKGAPITALGPSQDATLPKPVEPLPNPEDEAKAERDAAEEASYREIARMDEEALRANAAKPANMAGVREPLTPDRYKSNPDDQIRIKQIEDLTSEIPQGGPGPEQEIPAQPGELELELQKLKEQASSSKEPGLLDALAVIGTGLSGAGAERTMGVADRLMGGPDKRNAQNRYDRLSQALMRGEQNQDALASRERIAAGNNAIRLGLANQRDSTMRELAGMRDKTKRDLFDSGAANTAERDAFLEGGRMDRTNRRIEGQKELQSMKPQQGPSLSAINAIVGRATQKYTSRISALNRAIAYMQGQPGAMMMESNKQQLAGMIAERDKLEALAEATKAQVINHFMGSDDFDAYNEIFSDPQAAEFDAMKNDVLNELRKAGGR